MFVSSKAISLLTSAVLFSQISLGAGKNIEIEGFGETLSHEWVGVGDQTIGGVSESRLSLQNGVALIEGRVESLPNMSVPGFIAVRSVSGSFPNLNKCEGIMVTMRSDTEYEGLFFSLGTKYFNDTPHLEGFRTKMDAPMGKFADVVMPFPSFSDNWNPQTGEVAVQCSENTDFCIDRETLSDLKRVDLVAQGSTGNVKIEIDRIVAYSCDDDVDEEGSVDSNFSISNAQEGTIKDAQATKSTESVSITFDDSIMEGFYENRLKEGVGAQGGWMRPTVFENGDVLIENFMNPQHRWYAMSDSMLGGASHATVKVENSIGIFKGKVNSMANGRGGFIKMETRGGAFPDLSSCEALKIKMKSMTEHDNIRVDIRGIDSNQFNPGFRTKLEKIPKNKFGEVTIPFSDFTNGFDIKTGQITASCDPSTHEHCIDRTSLSSIDAFGLAAAGTEGEVEIEIHSIVATGCHIPESWTLDADNKVEAVVHVKALAAPKDSSSEVGNTAIILASVGCLIAGLFIGMFLGHSKSKKIDVTPAVESDIEIS